MTIMDIHGKIVYSLKGSIKTEPILIDATKFAAGTYMIQFNTSMGSFTKRIVIK